MAPAARDEEDRQRPERCELRTRRIGKAVAHAPRKNSHDPIVSELEHADEVVDRRVVGALLVVVVQLE